MIFDYSKCFHDGLKSEGEDEVVLLTRAAYPGSQKFGALVWNGDINSDFTQLRNSVVSGLSMAMCGIPWWNSDIGGFFNGIICDGGGYNEIWQFGERDYEIIKDIISLRYRLKPYILECSKRTSETGEPIMRLMFFDFPDDEQCYRLSDQYMFGPDILFAPVLDQGVTEREVYLPEGKWIRAGEKEIVGGGRTVSCRAEIDEFIAFVRADAARLSEVFSKA